MDRIKYMKECIEKHCNKFRIGCSDCVLRDIIGPCHTDPISDMEIEENFKKIFGEEKYKECIKKFSIDEPSDVDMNMDARLKFIHEIIYEAMGRKDRSVTIYFDKETGINVSIYPCSEGCNNV